MKKQQSVYVAKAGIEESIKQLSIDPAWREGYVDTAYGAGQYTVTVSDPNSDGSIPTGLVGIESVGRVGTQSTTFRTRYKGN